MAWQIELDFVPSSQKNKYERSRKFLKGGGSVPSLKLSDRFNSQRETLEWLMKALEKVPWDRRYSVEVMIQPKIKKTSILLIPEDVPVGKEHGVADPDGVLTTILDSLQRSGRAPSDSINHIARLSVTII